MAGILNKKQRIMDALITSNGRRQIADGTFNISFASFSDHGVFYRAGSGDVADDAGSRIMFESYGSPSDTVIPEINNEGAISMDVFSGVDEVQVNLISGKIIERSTTDVDPVGNPNPRFISGSMDVFSSSAGVIKNAINSFDNLQIIGTQNNWSDQDFFRLSRDSITFSRPLETNTSSKMLDMMTPIFSDEAMANLPAFKYLAPVYNATDGSQLNLAEYRKINTLPRRNYSDLISNLQSTSLQSETIEISSDDPYINIVSQVFEINDLSIGKLAIIDYGTYMSEDGRELGSVYHLGKLYRDSKNIPKFVKVLTIVFE